MAEFFVYTQMKISQVLKIFKKTVTKTLQYVLQHVFYNFQMLFLFIKIIIPKKKKTSEIINKKNRASHSELWKENIPRATLKAINMDNMGKQYEKNTSLNLVIFLRKNFLIFIIVKFLFYTKYEFF